MVRPFNAQVFVRNYCNGIGAWAGHLVHNCNNYDTYQWHIIVIIVIVIIVTITTMIWCDLQCFISYNGMMQHHTRFEEPARYGSWLLGLL